MSGYSDKYVHEILEAEELYNIAHNKHDFDYDIYLMTHATFRAGFKRIGSLKTARNILLNLKVGMKIIDDALLEFRDTLIMDFVFNVCRNIYLTATDGRSSKEENTIFRYVFTNTTFYREKTVSDITTPSKWVEYTTVQVNTHCKPNIYRYRIAGGRGMSPAAYGKWVIAYDKTQQHFNACKELLRMKFERYENSKVLLFMPLIDLCDEISHFCRMGLNYDDTFGIDLNIKTINSKNTKSENENNKRADVIVTTILSCGTGSDIKGITDIICCSPFKSQITARQVFGRIRYCGKVSHYYDIIDTSVMMDTIFHRIRLKVFKQLALSTNTIVWEDDT